MQSPYFRISYNSDQPSIARIEHGGAESTTEEHIKGVRPGKTDMIIQTEFKHETLKMDSFSAAISVKVDLKLELENFPYRELIIPPMSSYRLKLNKPDSVVCIMSGSL
jgi:hypothetical protein